MNVFMIGNGFDLHYCLPTTYTSFLRTVEYLTKKTASERKELTSVAQLFADKKLHDSDTAIQACYKKYEKAYFSGLDAVVVDKVFGNAAKNDWLCYILKSFDKGKNWIDFEREIRGVIDSLSIALEKQCINGKDVFLCVYKNDDRTNRICKCFNDLFEGKPTPSVYKDKEAINYRIKRNCLLEEPVGSGLHQVDKTKIAEVMFRSLRELVQMLATYLLFFVEYPVKNLLDNKIIQRDCIFEQCDWANTKIISFNYTHTMQLLYDLDRNSPPVYYIHGELEEESLPYKSNIVLGVDADEADTLNSMDVSFVQFKKYFQRVFYKTDLPYLDFLNNNIASEIPNRVDSYDLYVIGHSLDVTDKEVIRECFSRARSITIFYYCDSNFSNSISNLVKIYGKQGFDDLRTHRKLHFFHIDQLNDIDELIKENPQLIKAVSETETLPVSV